MSGSLSTPTYPPPAPLDQPGQMGSFDQDDDGPAFIDPSLINPPGTTPGPDTPGGLSSPGEDSAFVLPPPAVDNKPKKKGLKKLGGLGDSFRGGFNKVKGKFKKEQPKIKESTSIEAFSEEDLSGSKEYLDEGKQPPYPGAYESKPYDQPAKSLSKLDSLGASLRNLVKRPQNADPAPYKTGDVVELKAEKETNYITFGNFINVLLIAFIVAGIIMCACIGADHDLYYIGPATVGLGCFALVGKIFYTNVMWKEDPVPQKMKPTVSKMGKMFTPVLGSSDPYGLKSGAAYGGRRTTERTVYLGPMSTTSATNVVQMEPFTYPRMADPKMYDESIDTRQRYASII